MSYERTEASVTKEAGSGSSRNVVASAGLWMGKGLRLLADGLFPRICLSCRALIDDSGPVGRPANGLCAGCRRRAVRSTEDSFGSPSVPSADRHHLEALDGLFWGWSYEPPMDSVILAMKFRRFDFLARELAIEVADHLEHRLPSAHCLVPIPLHWTRRWRRGFDQGVLLARELSGRLGIPERRLLRRRIRTRTQSRLDLEGRRANVRSAFKVRRASDLVGLEILLVDDVTTTGATFESAARVLKSSGAKAVWGLAVARTPRF